MFESLTTYELITGTVFIVAMYYAVIIFILNAKHVPPKEDFDSFAVGCDCMKQTDRIESFRSETCHPSRMHSCPMAIPRITFDL